MPQGPAANIVNIGKLYIYTHNPLFSDLTLQFLPNIGDKITSITIDFQHIVQEDAATILSYASPYNVQLELLNGKGILPHMTQHSPSMGQLSLTHPLYRSSSQEDFNTIERNARKKLFPNDENNYPTLKMEQQRYSPSGHLPTTFNENEKKSKPKQFREIMEEKLQQKGVNDSMIANTSIVVDELDRRSVSPDDGKKGGPKFGIRVLPPTVNDKNFSGKSPNKVQADNDNNLNLEKTNLEPTKKSSPPPVSKRTKNRTDESRTTETVSTEFQRNGSINGSGIRRDAAGIPQEIPNQMLQAALAARDNRKSSSQSAATIAELKKSKGKAPRPPSYLDPVDMNESTDTAVTNLSVDTIDAATLVVSPVQKNAPIVFDEKLNFSDNFSGNVDFGKMMSDDLDIAEIGKGLSNTSTPRAERKQMSSDTESQLAAFDNGKLISMIWFRNNC